jgi:hypothetical protein
LKCPCISLPRLRREFCMTETTSGRKRRKTEGAGDGFGEI